MAAAVAGGVNQGACQLAGISAAAKARCRLFIQLRPERPIIAGKPSAIVRGTECDHAHDA
jgi:hypothetical protein